MPAGDPDGGAAIREGFGLPDRLPGLRLPDEAELASAARQSRLLASVRALAVWAEGRELTEEGELLPADLAVAARLLGVDVPAAPAGLDDVPALLQAWHLACCAEFLYDDDVTAELGEAADEWPDGTDDEVIGTWAAAFGHLCNDSLAIDADGDESLAGLALDSASAGLAMALFLARGEGLPRGECRSVMNELATVDLSPSLARQALAAWTRAHGEMADLLLERWSDHGAVEVNDDVARLTALAMWQMCVELEDTVEIPLLPPAAEMTAADLVAFGLDAPEDELARELQTWLAGRPAVDAARELVKAAADGGPAERMVGTSLAMAVGEAAEPLWRETLDDALLGSYAKVALNQIAGHDPAVDPLPGLEIGPDEMASMLSDTIMAMSDALDGEDITDVLRRAIPPGDEEYAFGLMGRSANPASREALEVLGRHHPDKKIAKAARKASYRARSQAGTGVG